MMTHVLHAIISLVFGTVHGAMGSSDVTVAVVEGGILTFSCDLGTQRLIWSLVVDNQTMTVATCLPYWNVVDCELTSDEYKNLYQVDVIRPSSSTSLINRSVLTVTSVDAGLTGVICQHGTTFNVTKVLVVASDKRSETLALPYVIVTYTATPIIALIVIVHIVLCVRALRRKRRSLTNTGAQEDPAQNADIFIADVVEERNEGFTWSHRNTPLPSPLGTPAHSARASPMHSPLHSPQGTPTRSRIATPANSSHGTPLPRHHHTRGHDAGLGGTGWDARGGLSVDALAPPNYDQLFHDNHAHEGGVVHAHSSATEHPPLPPSYSSVLLSNLIIGAPVPTQSTPTTDRDAIVTRM